MRNASHIIYYLQRVIFCYLSLMKSTVINFRQSFLRRQESRIICNKTEFPFKNFGNDIKINVLVLLFISVFIAFLMGLTGIAHAKDVSFQLLVDRNIIYLGQSAQLSLQFEGSTDIPALDLPDIEGFQTRYSGPSSRMSIVNGKMTSSITHIYRLVPVKTGKFKIGPFSLDHDGGNYLSNEIVIEVLDSASRAQGHTGMQRKQGTNLEDRVFVEMEIDRPSIYINEVAILHIKMYVNSMSIRDVQYPQYSHDGFSVNDFERPREYKINRDGVRYSVLDFQTEIFPTKAGKRTLGPAVIKANLITKTRSRRPSSIFGDSMFDDFFGGYESTPIELTSDELIIEALELPEENRPEDFKGAIGKFQLDVSVSPDNVKVGDPVTLKMTVTGRGNFDAVHSPTLESKEGFKLYDPQVKREPNRKIFEQVIIPVDEKITGLPDIEFSYFDTLKGEYITIVKANVPLKVMKAEKEEEITILDSNTVTERLLKKETLGRDIIYIKESPGKITVRGRYLYKNPLFIILQIVPLIIFAAGAVAYRKKERLSSDLGYARRLAAPRKARKGIKQAEEFLQKNNVGDFYDSVFRTLRDYIGNRFHIPSGGITAGEVDRVLDGKDLEKDIIGRLKNIFNECDMVRYAPSGVDSTKMNMALKDMREIIDYLERHGK